MPVQENYNSVENHFNMKLESILEESRHEMQERTHTILLEMQSQAEAAKKDVRHHISGLVKV